MKAILISSILAVGMLAQAEVKPPGTFVPRECARMVKPIKPANQKFDPLTVCIGHIVGVRTMNPFLQVKRTVWEMGPAGAGGGPVLGSTRHSLNYVGIMKQGGFVEIDGEKAGEGTITSKSFQADAILTISLTLDGRTQILEAGRFEAVITTL